MQLINSRYRVNRIFKTYDHSVLYMVYDLWNNNNELLLKLFINDSNNYSLFKELVDTFIKMKSLRHKCIIANHSLDIVSSINNKSITMKQFFYTFDFIKGTKLSNHIGKMNIDQILYVVYQLLELASYMAFRGYTYKFINPDNIFVVDSRFSIKLVDYATIYEIDLKNLYDDEYNLFTAPEIRLKQNDPKIGADIYSIGMVFKAMLSGYASINTEEKFIISKELGLSEAQKSRVIKIIKRLTDKDCDLRIKDVSEIAREINSIFGKDYKLNLTEGRNILNFSNPIIGRDKEINNILEDDSKLDSRIINKRLISFTGEEGIGKTRLLNELAYRLKMRKRQVYHTAISESNTRELSPIIRILKSMIKECDIRLIDTYGCELVKIIPEISESRHIKPSPVLSGTKERFRLYDRITKFIIEHVKNTPTYIIIDDLHNSDMETINLINYLINSSGQAPLVMIVSYDKDLLKKKRELSDTINGWISQKKSYEHRLLRLNLDETTSLIKSVLGISYKPIRFSTKVMNDTLGNPAHIEEAIKNFVATGELFINERGNWDAPTMNYTTLYIPPNIEDAIERQVKLLDKELLEIAKYVSIFNTSVSKNIIKKIATDYNNDVEMLIDRLVSMKILDERVEDWGFTYDFYNRHIKTFIYNDISNDEKLRLHEKAAATLENTYTQQDRGNIDELIYHYNMCNQTEKAINKIISNAKKMKGLAGNIQCIHLWENAYRLMEETERKDKDKLEVLANLGNLYLDQGMTRKSIKSYEEGLKIAKKINSAKYLVICYNGLAAAFYRRFDLELTRQYAEEAKKISERNGYIEELLKSVRLVNRVDISRGYYNKVFNTTSEYLEIAIEYGFDLYIGHFYNQMGIAKLHTGFIDLAKDYFITSANYFQRSGDSVETTRALNNIGYMYSDFLDDINTAMKYYEEGIGISRRFQSLENELTLLNNIGELYIRTNDYEKAEQYIERMESISRDIEDENSQFLSQVSFCLIYLFSGKFDKCHNHFDKANRLFNEGFVEDQNLHKYFYFLTNFYLVFGNYEKALEYLHYTINNGYGENIVKLDMRLKNILIKYWSSGTIDKEEIYEIRNLYKTINYSGERRKGLLILAHISILYGDHSLAHDLLLEDEEIKDIFTTDYLDLFRNMIIGTLNKDSDILISVSEKVKNKGYYEIELFTNIELGDIYFNSGKYYRAVNCYLTAFDLVYRLAKKIPDKSLQVTFVNKNRASMILHRLRKVVSVVKGSEVIYNEPIEYTENTRLEDFFNIKNIVDLFSEDIYNIGYSESSETEREIANSFEELILQLGNNYMDNLTSILNYAVNKTFASRGLIVILDFETDQLITVASTSQEDFTPDKEIILSEIKQKNKGILVNKSFGYEGFDGLSSINDNIKAMICMPIFKLKPLDDESNLLDRRKRNKSINLDSIIGYLYLDTDRIFNKFDSKRYKLIDALSHLISINIDNYILKIISSVDKLTGVYTRKHFDSVFKDFISMARRDGKDFTVIMIDIDKFKNVNDTFGHRKGDEILGRIGRIISENVRKTDIVGRYGGEEFIVVLPDTKLKEGEMVAEKIRKAVEKSNLINENYPVTISLGLSSYPEHGQSEEELIEKADQASYIAKETGRNISVSWSNDVGKSRKRLDRLAGIVTGNTVKDQRIGLVIIEIIDIAKEKADKEDKIFRVLGRIIEALEAEKGILITLDEEKNIESAYGRLRFSDAWIDDLEYNKKTIYKAINEQNGEYFIDWEDIREIDLVSGNPNWQSVIVVPLVNNGLVKGVLQLTVPIKEKEFEYNSFNLVNNLGGIIAAML
ncbi:Response regulator pleD Stalked cell differentiation-controlling protein [Proteiniborus sp. DW1]|uniref:diguanylate cyclase n=1 Tax=Proteiniborus sp. DW1 TaxID=1889883 RepID=UPI00092DF1A2|nr:diguanylate cyclase [Proteiniborus sp. DW1]SCG83105.1 Response regulator pleD Stalked cell differentiation-controlling protein [Proteiniborus sp. DW1]